MHIYDLDISVGQETGHNLVGSSTSRFSIDYNLVTPGACSLEGLTGNNPHPNSIIWISLKFSFLRAFF